MHNRQKKIAVINDFCGFGHCSLAVSIPIISALGFQCCPVPTAIFSNHTGFESFYRADFTEHMDNYTEEWKKLSLKFNGILTGFLCSEKQIEKVIKFIKEFKTEETVTVIDPVMGDNGKLYSSFSKELSKKYHLLLPFADILTPNLTEACILAEMEYAENPTDATLKEICGKIAEKGAKKIVISGIADGEYLKNFVFEGINHVSVIKEHKSVPCRSGTGDVFSSIIAADAVNKKPFAEAVRHASSFVAKTLLETQRENIPKTDGICFEKFLGEINRYE